MSSRMSSSSSDSSSDGEEPRLEMGGEDSQEAPAEPTSSKKKLSSSSSEGEGEEEKMETAEGEEKTAEEEEKTAEESQEVGKGARIIHSDDDFDADSGSPPARSPTPASPGEKKDSDKEKNSSPSEDSDDGEKQEPAAVNATQEELFGDGADLSSSSDEDKPEEEKRSPVHPDEIVGPRLQLEEGEEGDFGDDATQPAQPETVIDVQAPRIKVDLGSQIHFVKFPNFLSVEGRPFDPETYEDEIDDDDLLDDEGRRRLKLKVENTIRWRQFVDPKTGEMKKESNAKFVRWSDGSLSMYLGSEIFDVHVQPTPTDHNHLFIRQGAGLQGQEIFRTKLTFRPHSTDTLTHRKMTMSMADRSQKAHTVKVLAAVGKDPETMKAEMVRREEERMRAAARRDAQARRIREREAGIGRGYTSALLEDRIHSSSDEEDESISAIKKSYKPGGAGFEGVGGSDSDDSEARGQRLQAAKRTLDSDDDDSDTGVGKKEKKKRAIEDSDDDQPKAAKDSSPDASPDASPKAGSPEKEDKAASGSDKDSDKSEKSDKSDKSDDSDSD